MDNGIEKYIKAGRANLIVVYILFLCGVVAPPLPIIGVIFVYRNKDRADENLSSHYIFIIHTFYLSCAGIITLFCISVIGLFIFPAGFVLFLGTILSSCLYLWYILRVAIGFKYLLNYQPHLNYMTYWIK